MTIRKKILSAVLAGCIIASSVPAVLPLSASAAVSYDYSDYVYDYDSSLFRIRGESEINASFRKAIERAVGKTIENMTFSDLAKVTSFNISGLQLEGIPRVVEYMERLRTFNASNNRLTNYGIANLDLTRCVLLTSIDVSNNYLTSVPSWYVTLDSTTKNISNNLINTTNQRKITVTPSTYYFMLGETVSENALKDKILSTMKLSDGTDVPLYFFDPSLPTYDLTDDEIDDYNVDRNYNVIVNLDISKYIKNGVVTTTGTVKGTAGIDLVGDNSNVLADFTVYFLDGTSPSTMKIRLESLVSTCKGYTKNDYTSATWTAFEASLKTAQTILSYTNADASMITEAFNDLTEKQAALVGGVSTTTKKALTDLIAISKNFKEADYTAESWSKFQSAINDLTAASTDVNASVTDANAAIKSYQAAQAALVTTKLVAPDVIKKSQFESIYGENQVITASGTTRDGYKYSMSFNGMDVTAPADFDPSIVYQSKYESDIRYAVGSAGDFAAFAFAKTTAFPGTATVTLDVSSVYKNGTYRLYKWNTTTKKPEYIKAVTVKDGTVSLSLDNGGDYYISSVVQNFDIISQSFSIDNTNLTITGKFKSKYTVAQFRAALENGSSLVITNSDGTDAADTEYITTNMIVSAPSSSTKYAICVPGDIDGDGNVTALDAVQILNAIIGQTTLSGYAQKSAADLNGDGWVRADDAVMILKYCVGME